MARAKGPLNKHPSSKRPSKTFAPPPPPEAFGSSPPPSSETKASGFSLHDLFAQQARAMLDRTDLDEEQKQGILVAMSCPCCGAGGLSFTAKLKKRKS